MTRTSDSVPVHLRAAHQIIESPDAVPSLVLSTGGAEKQRLDAELIVFTCRTEPALSRQSIDVLEPFPLAIRIERHNHIALACQVLKESLIASEFLAVRSMSERR